jgi:hypothetical protein
MRLFWVVEMREGIFWQSCSQGHSAGHIAPVAPVILGSKGTDAARNEYCVAFH